MPPHWLVFYCDIGKVSLKYFYLRHFKLNFFTLHTLRDVHAGLSIVSHSLHGPAFSTHAILFAAEHFPFYPFRLCDILFYSVVSLLLL